MGMVPEESHHGLAGLAGWSDSTQLLDESPVLTKCSRHTYGTWVGVGIVIVILCPCGSVTATVCVALFLQSLSVSKLGSCAPSHSTMALGVRFCLYLSNNM